MRIEFRIIEEEKLEPGIVDETRVPIDDSNFDFVVVTDKINCHALDEVCSKLLKGQPVFILLAQDKFSPQFIRQYRDFMKEKKNQVWKRVDTALKSINEWRKNNKDRIKIPD